MRSTNNPSIDTYFPIILLFLCFGIRVSHSSPTGALEARTTASVSLFSLREDVPNSLNLAPPTYPFIPPYPHRLFARQQQQQQHVNATNSTTHLNATNPTVENVQAFVNSLKTGTGHGLASATNKISKIYTQVNDVYLAIALIPAFILCYGSVSSFLKEKL
ncbi:hypothetical protein VP01_417g1 [Puccinia sorghi]|uniref:Uncharacterized protein n=1 Tax=Puccinia sorghi TaxID=27349 RepID=A0A0L6USU5_9BASI|nr:hypothetical protein VP01_417g1 [Puccinia sorghi]